MMKTSSQKKVMAEEEDNPQPSKLSIPQRYRSSTPRKPRLENTKIYRIGTSFASQKQPKMTLDSLKSTKVVSTPRHKVQETELSGPPVTEVKFNAELETDNDLVEFRGLARLPRRQASLLEKECLENPILGECHAGKSSRWRQFAYETIGELIHFLRSTRHKEMNSEKRARLCQLWDEARGVVGPIPLARLEPWVRAGLESGAYMEREREAATEFEREIRRLDGERDTLRCQMTTLTMLMWDNDRAHSSMEEFLRLARDRVNSTEEAFLLYK